MTIGRRDGDEQGAEPDGFERIEPVSIAPSAADERRVDSAGNHQRSPVAAWLGLGFLLILVALVFLCLPTWIAPREADAPAPEAAADAEPAAASSDVTALLAERSGAEKLAAELGARLEKLEARALVRWDPVAAESLAADHARGAELFRTRDYRAAAAVYRDAIGRADARLVESAEALRRALERGREALEQGEAEGAGEAFALALAIEAENAAARKGAARAASLDRVRALVASGRESESAGKLDAAGRDYREALALDGEATAAREALARIDAARADESFARLMSLGLAALDRGDSEAARAAFRRASALRPGSPEATDGLARAEASVQSQTAARLRERAGAHESAEEWPAALAAYEEALRLDPTLAFARAGRMRASGRAELSRRLADPLAQAERLSAPEIQREAERALANAREVADPGPVLRRQMADLGERLALARQTIPVELRSDDATEVLLYKVGKLGRFASKEVALVPGSYTAIGRRQGYRDVRLEFRVPPGGERVGPIVILCEERI